MFLIRAFNAWFYLQRMTSSIYCTQRQPVFPPLTTVNFHRNKFLVAIANGITTQLCGNPYIGMTQQVFSLMQMYVVIPLAIATRNLFHNFLSLRSLLPFKMNIF